MTQLLFIETFVLGSAAIAAIYHLMLFIQQREKYLIAYSIYLFSLSSYILFKIVSDNYNPYIESHHVENYYIEEFLQIVMVCIYASFAAITLNVTRKDKIVMSLWMIILLTGAISIFIHIYEGIGTDVVQTSRLRYAISRFTIIGCSVAALIVVWQSRKTIFQRTIIVGSFVYAFAGFSSAVSFTTNQSYLGLGGVEPYLLGCLIDIIIFSSAFGYRIKQIAIEKNELLEAELEAQRSISLMRTGIASNLHDDIGSTLSSISIYSEAAKKSLQLNEKDKAIQLLSQLGNEARDTISNMSDIVWAINPRNDSAEKLVSRMRSFATQVCSAKGIVLHLDISEFQYTEHWSMAKRNNFFLIFKESVNNSVKYSGTTELFITFSAKGESAELCIQDIGSGFEMSNENGIPSANRGGNGIHNMYERAKEIKAKLIIHSTLQKGTEIRLIMNNLQIDAEESSQSVMSHIARQA